MKRCPTCQRTYSDDTITFCLADGSLLSPPYDPQPTAPKVESYAEPPPTEIYPTPPAAEPPRPTEPVQRINRQSTILASPIGAHQSDSELSGVEAKPSRRIWMVSGVLIVLVTGILLAVVLINQTRSASTAENRNQSITSASPTPERSTAAVNSPTPAQAGTAQIPATPTPAPSPSPSPFPAEMPESKMDRAQELLRRAQSGENFASLARKYSDDPAKVNGGDLGWFGRGMMVKPFEDAAFALQPGQVSGLVSNVFGISIIKMEGRRTAEVEGQQQEQIRVRHILIGKDRK